MSLTCAELSVDFLTGVWSEDTLNADTIVWSGDQIPDLITCALDKPFNPWFPVNWQQAKHNLRKTNKQTNKQKSSKLLFRGLRKTQFKIQLSNITKPRHFIASAVLCIYRCLSFLLMWVCTVRACNVLGHSFWPWLYRGHTSLKSW